MRVQRLLWQLWPWRWSRAVGALLRGVRMHPSVVLVGMASQFEFRRGTVMGARVRLDAGRNGQLTTGEGVWLAADTEIETGTSVRIGSGTTIQRRGSVNGSVRIGRGCILAPNVFVSSGTHPFRTFPHLPIREQERLLAQRPDGQESQDRPVWIQDDCWLGVNAVVCPGVTVGKGSVVGANAVVTRDVAPYSVVGGAPARLLSQRLAWMPPPKIRMDREEDLVYVLSGMLVRVGGKPAAIAVSAEEPLAVVMATPANRGLIHYRTPVCLEVRIGGVRQVLEPGDRVIEFPVQPASDGRDSLLLEVVVLAADSQCALQVFQVSAA